MLIEVGEHVKVLNVTRHDEMPGIDNRQTSVIVRPGQLALVSRWENDSIRLITATHTVHVKATADALDRIMQIVRPRTCEKSVSVPESMGGLGVTP
jgi:hypothetical protein